MEKTGSPSDRPLILVVDDEPALVDAIGYSLRREGWSVITAGDGPAAIEQNRNQRPDLIVLDVMLPGLDGLQVCRAIRTESNVPVLFLSARAEDVDRIIGLEIGGDDYLSKPFVMRELVARVRANLRRVASRQQGMTGGDSSSESAAGAAPRTMSISLGRVQIDFEAHRVMVDGADVPLKPKEYDLLAYLARRPDVAISRETLLREVWKYSVAVDTRTVDVHIRGLRLKLESDPAHPTLIETVRTHGYRLRTAAVERSGELALAPTGSPQ